jgi:hypothetical protein
MGRYETICKDNREFIQELEDGVYDKRGALKNNVLYVTIARSLWCLMAFWYGSAKRLT